VTDKSYRQEAEAMDKAQLVEMVVAMASKITRLENALEIVTGQKDSYSKQLDFANKQIMREREHTQRT